MENQQDVKPADAVLVLGPTATDSNVAVDVLQDAGLNAIACKNLGHLCDVMLSGCGALVIAEEALHVEEVLLLQNALSDQEPWSDIPVILLTNGNNQKATEAFPRSGNISLLERPFARLTLIQAAVVALRARHKQYQVRDLLEQQAQATQKRDEFFATLSHELRTPLNVILGWLDILKNEDRDSQTFDSALEILDRNANIQKGLIDDLLDISRIVTGKLIFDFKSISLTDTIRSTTSAFIPRAAAKNINVDIGLPNETLAVMADEQRLSQVVSNLLTNAIKFTPEGGKIRVSLIKHQDRCTLTVQDTGQGVDPAFLPHIFDRLKQEDMSTTRNHGGLGLGLAIAAHIVEEHKGMIQAHSLGRGQGMTVSVSLPVLTQKISVPMVQEEIELTPNLLSGVRVLVVDDSLDILFLLRMWLEKAGAEVKLTHSAAEVLQEIDSFKPHVFVSDIGMPEVDGYQLISKIRSLQTSACKDVPAIALTAYAREEEKARALNTGFQMHISKPISNYQLVTAVSSMAQKSQAAGQ